MDKWDLTKDGDEWKAKEKGRTVPGTKADNKADAVKQTADAARKRPDPVSVNIHLENGQFEEERTYPREADPPSSKG